MKKHHIVLAVLLSLLAGILITVCTSRVDRPGERNLNTDCGYSLSSANPDQRTDLHHCMLTSYGWPLRYANSGVTAILHDYHTIFPYDPTNAGSIIGYTSFSRLRFTADWMIWSVVSFALITATCMVVDKASKPTPKAKHSVEPKDNNK